MIERMLEILVEAGATPTSAARAAVMVDAGCSIKEAREVLEYSPVKVATFDAQLLIAQARRERVLVEARRGL